MNTIEELDALPEPLNGTDFMWAVVAHTPHTKLIGGPVDVEVLLDIDEHGSITRIQTKHPDIEIRSAAGEACRVLRFSPARLAGQAVACTGYPITIGFMPEAELPENLSG